MPHLKPNEVLKLIKLVKCRPYIWNTKYEKYNDRFLVETGWKEIEGELTVSGDVLRQKWRNLRDTFRRQLKKYPCRTPRGYNGQWIYFKPLFFVAEPTICGWNGEEMSEAENEEEYEESLEETCFKIDHNEENEYTDCEMLEEEEQDVKEELKTTDQNETSNNYDLMFLKSLVPYFSHLDPIRKLVLRSKINNILLKELSDQARPGAMHRQPNINIDMTYFT